MGRYSEVIHVRLSNDDLEFIEMISRKTGLTKSEAVRLAIWMFRIVLGLEAVDVDKVARAFKEAYRRVIEGESGPWVTADERREEG